MGLARNERLLRQALREMHARPRQTAEALWLDRNGLKLVDAAAALVKTRKAHPELIDDALAESLSGLQDLIQDVAWPLRAEIFDSLRAISSWIVHVVQPEVDEQVRQLLDDKLSNALDLATKHLELRGYETP
jgi:hypothetical protein